MKSCQNVSLRRDERLGDVPYIVYIDWRLHQTENCPTRQTGNPFHPLAPAPPIPHLLRRCGKIQIHSTQILRRNTREDAVGLFKNWFLTRFRSVKAIFDKKFRNPGKQKMECSGCLKVLRCNILSYCAT
jgi:hypothetical protein